MPTPSPAPGAPPGGVPDPGVRPPGAPQPTPSPSPGPAPTPPPPSSGDEEDKGWVERLVDGLGVGDGITAVRAWVSDRHNWTRVSWFLSGSLLFGVGAAMIAGKPAASAVTTVLPAGKAAKLAMGAIK